MQSTDDHFIIRIPRFAGYKTLAVNGAVILGGIIAAIYPQFGAKVDPTAFANYYDAITGGIVAMIGVVNVLLRLISTGPAAPFKPVIRDAGTDPTGQLNFTRSLLGSHLAQPEPVMHMMVGEAIRIDAAHIASCTFPDCACHQRCDCELYPVVRADHMADLAAEVSRNFMHNPEMHQVVTLEAAAPDGWRAWPIGQLRGVASAFLVPFVCIPLLFSSLALLGGCETVQAVNAVASAESIEQRGFALYGTYVTIQERAAELVQDRSIPKTVRKRIQQADRIAYPLAERVRELSFELNEERLKLGTLTGTPDKVAAAAQALATAVKVFVPALQAVTLAVNDGRRA